jgi:glycerate kinase
VNVLIAPDSFKGSLSAVRAAGIIAESIARCDPAARCVLLPQADGGEGTIEVLRSALGGRLHRVRSSDPLGRPLQAQWLALPDGRAVIESASCIGYDMLSDEERKPAKLRSSGLGSIVAEVLALGRKNILVALGGSATNDAGIGFAEGLGLRLHFENDPGSDVLRALRTLKRIEGEAFPADIEVTALADVGNPLCGVRGATAVYGPQKGVSALQLESFDRAIAHFASIVRRDIRYVDTAAAGMGAAGGLGFALAAFCRARVRSGADFVRQQTGFSEQLRTADLVITGEGRIDAQSREGKVISGVAAEAKAQGVPVVAFAGTISGSPRHMADAMGLAHVLRITTEDMPLDTAMHNAGRLLAEAVAAHWPHFSGTR